MKKGFLITFEGGEGSGKTTQLFLLREKLKSLWFDEKKLLILREPGGTEISEQIRTIIKNPENIKMFPETELLLFEAARAQIVREKITPFLEKPGTLCILDRFCDSTNVYQGVVRGLGLKITSFLNDFATGGLKPDLTIFFDIDPEVGLARRGKEGEKCRLDSETIKFHKLIRKGYLRSFFEEKTDRWVRIDGSLKKEEVFTNLWKVIEGRLIQKGLLESESPIGAERRL